MAKEFKLGDVLSVITPFCLTSMPELTALLGFMTGEERGSDMWTLHFVSPCAHSLRRQFPELASIQPPDVFEDQAHTDRWVAEQVAIYGETLMVMTLAEEKAAGSQ